MRSAYRLLSLLGGLSLAAGLWTSPGQSREKTHPQEWNLFVVPDKALMEPIVNLSERLKDYGIHSYYARGYLPHVTLYLSGYEHHRKKQLQSLACQLARGSQPFEVRIVRSQVTPSNWLFLTLEYSPELQKLADKSVLHAAALRSARYQAPKWVKHYEHKRIAFERYGSPNVFMEYDPHFTQLASEKNPELQNFMNEVDPKTFSGKGKMIALGLARVDAQGQMRKTDAQIFPLGHQVSCGE